MAEECNFAHAGEPLSIISRGAGGVPSRVTVPVIFATVAESTTFVGADCCAAAGEDCCVVTDSFPPQPARTRASTMPAA